MANDVIKNGVVALLAAYFLEMEHEPEEEERWLAWLRKHAEDLSEDATFTPLIDGLLEAVDQANASVPTQTLAAHAVEELHQLGYTVKNGLLYPPAAGFPIPADRAARGAAQAAPVVAATMAAEYERWIGFFHRGDGDYNDFLRIELNHDTDRAPKSA